jgi:plasmid replication initiation protein
LSHKPRPIKVVDTALSVARKADEIALETAKTGKVTAVVAIMSIFKRKKCKLRSAILGNERPSRQRAERADFSQEISGKSRNLSQKKRKGRIPKKLAPNSKKLQLNSTNLVLKSKNTRSDHAVVPDLSDSSGLYVKNKTIRVQSSWSETGGPRVASARGTLIFGTSLYATE